MVSMSISEKATDILGKWGNYSASKEKERKLSRSNS